MRDLRRSSILRKEKTTGWFCNEDAQESESYSEYDGCSGEDESDLGPEYQAAEEAAPQKQLKEMIH